MDDGDGGVDHASDADYVVVAESGAGRTARGSSRVAMYSPPTRPHRIGGGPHGAHAVASGCRRVVTGMDDGRDEVAAAFGRCLLSDAETRARGMYWEAVDDGFEAWLGDIHSPL